MLTHRQHDTISFPFPGLSTVRPGVPAYSPIHPVECTSSRFSRKNRMKLLFKTRHLQIPCFVFFSLLLTCVRSASADTLSMQRFGDYTVHFSVFNSTFITPEVASAYQLTRARD